MIKCPWFSNKLCTKSWTRSNFLAIFSEIAPGESLFQPYSNLLCLAVLYIHSKILMTLIYLQWFIFTVMLLCGKHKMNNLQSTFKATAQLLTCRNSKKKKKKKKKNTTPNQSKAIMRMFLSILCIVCIKIGSI